MEEGKKQQFEVCYCGSTTRNNHHFRHLFEPVTTVTLIKINDKPVFEFDASNFKKLSLITCNYPGCSGPEGMHRGGDIHRFEPKETFYKDIKLCIPETILENYVKENNIINIRNLQRLNNIVRDITEPDLSTGFAPVISLKISNFGASDKIRISNENYGELKYVLV